MYEKIRGMSRYKVQLQPYGDVSINCRCLDERESRITTPATSNFVQGCAGAGSGGLMATQTTSLYGVGGCETSILGSLMICYAVQVRIIGHNDQP